jgi:hypothetical protein
MYIVQNERIIMFPTSSLLTLLAARLLGSAGRAADLVADSESRLAMLDRWHLRWTAVATTPSGRKMGRPLSAVVLFRAAQRSLG